MSNAITKNSPELAAVQAREMDWKLTQRQAHAFLQSGIFQDVRDLAQAIVKVELGRAIGLSPIEAMQSINIIKGRPAIASEIRAARMKQHGYDWRVLRLTDDVCELAVYRNGQELGRVSYTYQEAQNSGLAGKDNWKHYRTDMLFARAITRAQRRYAPEVLGLPIPSRDEAMDAEWSEIPAPEPAPTPQQETGQQQAGAIVASKLREKIAAAKAAAIEDEQAEAAEIADFLLPEEEGEK